MNRWWRAETGFFLAIWLLLMIAGQTRLLRDPGTLWHTVCGERMLTSASLIRTDPFSFSLPEQPWFPHQWLGEIAMALLHRQAELDTLLLATATLLAGLFSWFSHRLLRSGFHWSLVAVLLALTLMASTSHYHARPHLITIVFLPLTFARLIDYERGRIGIASLWLLVPVFLLWTNVHGGMLGGLATFALALIGWCMFRLLGATTPITAWSRLYALGAVFAVCSATMLVNPFGGDLPRTWFKLLNMPLGDLIQEHAPLRPDRIEGMGVLVFAVVYLLLLLGVPMRGLRVSWLIPLAWLVLTLKGIRHAPLFAGVAILAIADFFPHTIWARWLERPGSDLYFLPADDPPKRSLPWTCMAISFLVVLSTFLVQRAELRVPVIGRGWARLDATMYPMDLVDWLRQLPQGTRLLNDLDHGGFLIYHVPNVRIYVDDRCEFYGRDFLLENQRLQTVEPERVEHLRDQFGFNNVLVVADSPLDRYLSRHPNWHILAEDPTSRIYGWAVVTGGV